MYFICMFLRFDFTPEDETPSDIYELKAIPDKEVIFKTYPRASMKQILGAGYDVTAVT